MPNVEFKPRNQFAHVAEQLKEKYGTYRTQLSVDSFDEHHRHLYALEAMALSIINYEYEEGIFTATKGTFPPLGSHGSEIPELSGGTGHISNSAELKLNPSAAQHSNKRRVVTSFEEERDGIKGEL